MKRPRSEGAPLSFRKQLRRNPNRIGACGVRRSLSPSPPTRFDTGRNHSQAKTAGGKPFPRTERSGERGTGTRGRSRNRGALTIKQSPFLFRPSRFRSRSASPASSYRRHDSQHGAPLPAEETRPERTGDVPRRWAIHRTCCCCCSRRRRCCCRRDGDAAPVRGGELISGEGRRRCGAARAQTCCAAGGARGQREREKREREREDESERLRPSTSFSIFFLILPLHFYLDTAPPR